MNLLNYKREIYHYNPVTCSYEKEVRDWKYYLKRAAFYLSAGVGVAVFWIVLYYLFTDSNREAMLHHKINQLETAIDQYNEKYTELEDAVAALDAKDADLYKFILNTDRLDKEEVVQQITDSTLSGDITKEGINAIAEKIDAIHAQVKQLSDKNALILELTKMKKEELRSIPAVRPIQSEIICGFGQKNHPIHKTQMLHHGIDFKAAMGTPVQAAGDGIVREAGTKKDGLGNVVIIQHRAGYTSVYAHLSKTNVYPGKSVKRGDIIGLSGNTGLSKGPHLHFEVLKNNVYIDPLDLFLPDMNPKEYQEMKAIAEKSIESFD